MKSQTASRHGLAPSGSGPHQPLSAQMLEVGTNHRVREVCEAIATKLQLASWEGCSLFIKIADKVHSQWARGWRDSRWISAHSAQLGLSGQSGDLIAHPCTPYTTAISNPILTQTEPYLPGYHAWLLNLSPKGLSLEAAPSASLCPFPSQVISQKEGDFFFDSLRQVSDWVRRNKPQKEGAGSVWVGGGGIGWGCPTPGTSFTPCLYVPKHVGGCGPG